MYSFSLCRLPYPEVLRNYVFTIHCYNGLCCMVQWLWGLNRQDYSPKSADKYEKPVIFELKRTFLILRPGLCVPQQAVNKALLRKQSPVRWAGAWDDSIFWEGIGSGKAHGNHNTPFFIRLEDRFFCPHFFAARCSSPLHRAVGFSPFFPELSPGSHKSCCIHRESVLY